MRIGVTLPQFGPAGLQADVARFAREAEGAGVAGLWVGDRLLNPVDPVIGYAGGEGYPEQFRSSLDPFVLLAAAAAATSTAVLGTNVLNAPWYPPALLARTAASLDVISGGRLRLGLGTGWSPEEFAAVGSPMTERGTRLDECLDVLDAWFTGDPVAHEGALATIAPSHVEARRPTAPPVLLAGWAPRAMERVARRSDGWLPVAVPGSFDAQAQLAAPLARIRELAVEAGREASAVGAVLRVNPQPGTSVAAIVDTALAARDTADVHEVFVELMYLTDDVDGGLALVTSLVDALADR